MTSSYAAEIRDIVAQIVDPIANFVTVEDHRASSNITVILRTGKTITKEFVHGLGYSATARDWAKSILIEYGPSSP